MLQVVAFSGSIRKASTNTGLLRAVAKLVEASDDFESFTLVDVDLPLFNEGTRRALHQWRFLFH